MAENVDPSLFDFQPPKKLLKTSSGKGFNPPATDEDIALSKGCVPKNSVKNNAWALQVLCYWISERNSKSSDSMPKCPQDLLDNPSSGELSYWLSCLPASCAKAKGAAGSTKQDGPEEARCWKAKQMLLGVFRVKIHIYYYCFLGLGFISTKQDGPEEA